LEELATATLQDSKVTASASFELTAGFHARALIARQRHFLLPALCDPDY
jgi:hypothetical protein